MTKLEAAILASLPRPEPEGNTEGFGKYTTALGLKLDHDAHPLLRDAGIRQIRAALGHLRTLGLVRGFSDGRRGTQLYQHRGN